MIVDVVILIILLIVILKLKSFADSSMDIDESLLSVIESQNKRIELIELEIEQQIQNKKR